MGNQAGHVTAALHPRLQALQQQFAPSPVQLISDARLKAQQIELWIKRDDRLHPIISGNKWRKLKYILNHALSLNAECIVSMGGAYSNHLHALAYAGKLLGLKTVGLVRGEPAAVLNPTLQDLQDWGMQIRYVPRDEYRHLRDYKNHDSLPGLQSGQYWLPEGGATALALQGVAEIITEIQQPPIDVLVVACGTGTTLAGLVMQSPATTQVLGIAALKNAGFLQADVQHLLTAAHADDKSWQILLDYHHGGFAKTTPALLAFMQQFSQQHGIPLEPIYTGKCLFAVYDLAEQGYFSAGQRVLVLHTGGLQGART